MQNSILILVHPGSACKQADNTARENAEAMRIKLAKELTGWEGGILIIDNQYSHDLNHYPSFNAAVGNAIRSAEKRGSPVARIFACDEISTDWTDLIANALKAWRLDEDTYFDITGAWYSRQGHKGSVNVVYDLIMRMGFQGNISNNAISAD
jgi:hypothetical protein